MILNEQIPPDQEREIDLAAAWQIIWKYKYTIGIAAALCGLAAAILALIATPIYRAEATITEVRDGSMGAAGSFASQLGGLASLAGVNLMAGGGASREAQAVLKSRYLVEELIRRHALLPELSRDAKEPLTLWFAVKQFQEGVLTIREDKLKGVTTVTVDWPNPVTAARWANWIVALVNELIRARALNDSSRNITYLNDQIAKTGVVELKRVMYNLIENETKTLMLANARVEYAFTVVDPAVPPEVRISPKRTLMVLFGIVLGAFMGTCIAFWHNELNRRRRRVSSTAAIP